MVIQKQVCHDTSESEAKVPSVCCRVSAPVSNGLRESSCNCEKDNNGQVTFSKFTTLF
jgi:hypothetical protein